VVLGDGTLRRATQSGLVAADLRIEVRIPETAELVLTIENGDNQPLSIERIQVELSPQPWMFFEARHVGNYTVEYGSDKLSSPRYDLEAERNDVPRRPLVEAHWRGSGSDLSVSRPGASPGTPSEALLRGSVVVPSQFSYSRTLVGSGDGMTRVRLDAAVYAHSNDLSDLRILDAQNRQVPYLVERELEPLRLALHAEALVGHAIPKAFDDRQSVYRIELPFATLPAGRLLLTTRNRIFRRNVGVYVEVGERPGKAPRMRVIANQAWAHADEQTEPPPLQLGLPARVERQIYLAIEDGDNAPLGLGSVSVALPSRSLRFYHPENEALTLYYGSPRLAAPRYDLALLARELEQLPSREGSLRAERLRTQESTAQRDHVKWFWVVLVAAVLAIMALIARLVQKA